MSQSNETPLIREEEALRLAKKRQRKDAFANSAIQLGGFSVILAITLIFVYLLLEVWPLFQSGSMKSTRQYAAQEFAPGNMFLDVDEYGDTGISVRADGTVRLFSVADGKTSSEEKLGLPEGVSVVAAVRGQTGSHLVGFGLSNGQVIVGKADYHVDYSGTHRAVTPELSFPYGKQALVFDDAAQPLQRFSVRGSDDGFSVLGITGGKLVVARFEQKKTESAGLSLDEDLGGGSDAPKEFARTNVRELPWQPVAAKAVLMGADARWAYVIGNRDEMQIFKLSDDDAKLYQRVNLFHGQKDVSTATMLMGENSLLIGDGTGTISQWFLARDPKSEVDEFHLAHIRDFSLGKSPVSVIQPEFRRKGFLAGDEKGNVGLFYTTSSRTIAIEKSGDARVNALAQTFRGEGLLVQTDKGLSFWNIHNRHPDVSMQSALGKVWYEGYPEPTYTWQSSSGTTDFESKLSLVPLTFGTIKAAFWAMLLAAPLAICGAMYTAVFMAPRLRTKVKPAVELMQALPTVILGFLAGLWLAPIAEENLPGIFSLLIVTPVVILVCGFLWMKLPLDVRSRFPEGWVPVLLLLPILAGGWASLEFSQAIELSLFGGDVRHWLESVAGIKFDQRNALIVGLVMGFAVIAPIFSISEDALFAVPKHLTNGSLALGATQWQTLVRVVLPTAMPGIFSAFMIGFGRAVGETMIVLMATGNTPVMEWNVFEGMRTLSANVAVEMGEAEVGSTHFRMLFLSALVLFVLTFILNTVAEVVRTRLRKKYGSL